VEVCNTDDFVLNGLLIRITASVYLGLLNLLSIFPVNSLRLRYGETHNFYRNMSSTLSQLILYGANPDNDEQKWLIVRAVNS
jgi:hypothetical protein